MFRIIDLYRTIARQGKSITALNNRITQLNGENAYYKELLTAKNHKIDNQKKVISELIDVKLKTNKGE